MARFNAAVMDGATDKKFQNRYNQLIDLLDTAYTVEKRVNSELRKVTINPNELISIMVGGDEVFGIDEDGRVFASSLTNNSDSDCYLTVGTVGTKIGMLLYRKSISESIPVMRFVVGSGSAPDPGFHWEYMGDEIMYYDDATNGWIRKVDGVIRERISANGNYNIIDHNANDRFTIGADGSMLYIDHNAKTRMHFYADGGIELVDTSFQQVFTAQGGASEDVYLTCKNNSNMNIGVNSTGAYYTNGSATKNYFSHVPTKLIGTTGSSGAGGSALWLKIATFTFDSRYEYVSSVIKIIGTPSTGGLGYGATLYATAIQQSAFPTAPVGKLYISDCVNMAVGNFVMRVTYTAADATVIEVWAQDVHTYKSATVFLVEDVGSGGKVYTAGTWQASPTAGTDLTVTKID